MEINGEDKTIKIIEENAREGLCDLKTEKFFLKSRKATLRQ